VIVIAGLAFIVPFIPRGDQAQPGLTFWIGLSLFAFVAVCLAFVWALITQLMFPSCIGSAVARGSRLLKPWIRYAPIPGRSCFMFYSSCFSSRGGYD
jgi:hypothetical protein